MKTISIVVPVFRNEGTIKATFDAVCSVFEERLSGYDTEFVFVDDGSDDGSLDEMKGLIANHPRIKAIVFARNYGQVQAIAAGMSYTTGDAVVVMSADLQDPPDLIAEMVREWERGFEVVVCHRDGRADDMIARLTSRLFYRLIRISEPQIPAGGFDYFLLARNVTDELNNVTDSTRFLQADILWMGNSVKMIPYRRLRRTIGTSQWSLSKKLKYFIDGVLSVSYLPIRLMSLVGILTALMGSLYAAVIVYSRFIDNMPFQGWAPIMILILMIGGVIMLMLGIIGEYVWRIYDETRTRPNFVIRERIESLVAGKTEEYQIPRQSREL